MNKWIEATLPPPSNYAYSKPILIKEWKSGGKITAMVGYVKQHPEKNRIVLEKFWIGRGGEQKTQKYNIQKGDWQNIRETIESLLPEIGESPTSGDIDLAINKIIQDKELLEVVAKYPTLLSQIPKDVDILKLPEEQKEAFRQLLTTGGEIANSVISKLAKEPITDLKQFATILENLKLSTINSLVTHITGRINFIQMFEKVIDNDESYERQGTESVHGYLRQNVWLVDRNFVILHDDTTIKNIIKTQWQKDVNETDVNKRPDFLCMSNRNSNDEGYSKLVIIEIKRPSIKITMEHIKQVMTYKTILQTHSGNSRNHEFKCILIGKEIDDLLIQNPLDDSGFITKTYSDFIGDARKFYNDYLDIIKTEDFAF